jgi:Protein of unknown function (DUF2934)
MKTRLEIRIAAGRHIITSPRDFASEEKIRERAYELYEQRERSSGNDLNDWLQAEAEAREDLLAA